MRSDFAILSCGQYRSLVRPVRVCVFRNNRTQSCAREPPRHEFIDSLYFLPAPRIGRRGEVFSIAASPQRVVCLTYTIATFPGWGRVVPLVLCPHTVYCSDETHPAPLTRLRIALQSYPFELPIFTSAPSPPLCLVWPSGSWAPATLVVPTHVSNTFARDADTTTVRRSHLATFLLFRYYYIHYIGYFPVPYSHSWRMRATRNNRFLGVKTRNKTNGGLHWYDKRVAVPSRTTDVVRDYTDEAG